MWRLTGRGMERRAWLLAVAAVAAACAKQKPPSFDYGEARKTYAMRGRMVR